MSSPVTRHHGREPITHPKSGEEIDNEYTPLKLKGPQHNLLLAYCVLSTPRFKLRGYCDSLSLSTDEILQWATEVIRNVSNVKNNNPDGMLRLSSDSEHGSRSITIGSESDLDGRLPLRLRSDRDV
jgi:hypothetical protein